MKLWPFPFGKKAAPQIMHTGGGQPVFFLQNLDLRSGAAFDYSEKVGTGMNASVVMAPVQWVQRAMMEAPLVVEKQQSDGEWEQVVNHPLTQLIKNPNEFYDETYLWAGTVFSYLTSGNAYWMIIPNGRGEPVELWYVPHWMMTPVGSEDGTKFITHYQYEVGGKRFEIPQNCVVHFRHGVDPTNPRKGLSPLGSALLEIWTDIEAIEFIAAVLRNGGIPGLLISPDSDSVQMQPGDAEELKQYIKEKTTGSHRGDPIIMSGKSKVDKISWSPKEIDLTPASNRAEERVCALIGIPTAVVGFGSGLETTKVGATMESMRKLAWTNGVIPMQKVFSGTVGRQLLPLFRMESASTRAVFDKSEVVALQEDINAIWERVDKGVQGGWVSVAQAKRAVGMEPEVGDDVYLRRLAITEVQVGTETVMLEIDEEDEKRIAIELKADPIPQTFEERLGRDHESVPATAAQIAYMDIQERMEPKLRAILEETLAKFFIDELGARAEAAARLILPEPEKQATPEDAIIAERIIEAMNMDEITPLYAQVISTHYLEVAEGSTALAMDVMGLATGIPDPVARAIVATGGTRAGLVDLTKQSKDALFKALEAGRAEGRAGEALARDIRSQIEKGPWASVETRARIIARTETKHAQRISTLHMAKDQGVEQFRVFDARLGLTDADCESVDGIVVDVATADELASSEHPNGTRDFVPHFG